MKPKLEFLVSVQEYSILLLDASTPDERAAVADEIADDPELAGAVLMLLAEAVKPLLPEPQETPVQ